MAPTLYRAAKHSLNIYAHIHIHISHTYLKMYLSFTSHLSTANDLLQMPLCEKF